MKVRAVVLALLSASLMSFATVVTTLAAGTWKDQTPPAGVAATVDYQGVFFFDLQHGWVVGGEDSIGTALYTTDGGTTWKKATVPAPPVGTGVSRKLYGVHFVSLKKGFAVGRDGTILTSTDGGVTWTVVPNTPSSAEFRDVRFGDAGHGCAVGGGMAIMCTSDGGTTWNVVTNVPQGSGLEGISYGSPTVAYAVGDSGIFKTVNAGVADVTTMTWAKLTDPAPNPGHTAATFGDVHCTDATHCWLAGDQASIATLSLGSAAIAATTNGTTFTMQPACAAYGLEAVALPPGDNLHGWAGGSTVTQPIPGVPGSMCVTSNGGSSAWTVQAQTSHDEVKDIAFVDACHGWAVTESNGIMAFVDPISCLPAPSPSASPVGLPKAGHGPGPDLGWVVGALVVLLAAGGLASLRRASRS